MASLAVESADAPLRMCHASQAAGGALVAFIFGFIPYTVGDHPAPQLASPDQMGVLGSSQSPVQLFVQIVGAALGSFVMSRIDGSWFMIEDARTADMAQTGINRLQEPGHPLSQIGVRMLGGFGGACLSWLLLAPGLDFSLIVSALFISGCAVGAALATEGKRKTLNAAGVEEDEDPDCLFSVLMGFGKARRRPPQAAAADGAQAAPAEERMGCLDVESVQPQADTVGNQETSDGTVLSF
eukprot:TRINITY_DN36703_c0_g1_i2.p1 TRINITY_DN36703_c0_g1~~TRINITY_DN36703_c0_g1_i2.p1  ORF type:complete len:240 (-),score=42.96 TRINITY_DN36703_c0_g1_i2:834-1553(-)